MTGLVELGAERVAAAAAVLLAYTALCAWAFGRQWRRQRAGRLEAERLDHTAPGGRRWLVLFASQTGNAERIARQTAEALHAAGHAARVLALDALPLAQLNEADRALLVLSTCGEGDPPDNAAGFLRMLETAAPAFGRLQYGLLSLGDSSYPFFCGFGRAVDAALAQRGARRLFAPVEVDQGNPAALQAWRDALAEHAGTHRQGDHWSEPPWTSWTLEHRRQLNPGSAGEPIWLLRLQAVPDGSANWQAGDLVQLRAPGEDSRPRDYSIASIPADGAVELVVRRTGRVSGWLTDGLKPGTVLDMRLRAHPHFRLGDNTGRRLLLIGNGTGIAGLRAHLRACAAVGQGGHWLLFGERHAAHDMLLADEVDGWLAAGVLSRVDRVFSRDQARPDYVQHRLLAAADTLHDWVQAGAAIYVCGSLAGMARGVDETLRSVLGDDAVQALAAAGRYRRDVY